MAGYWKHTTKLVLVVGLALRPVPALPAGAVVLTPPKLIEQADIGYPPIALARRAEGLISAEYSILEDGSTSDIHVVGDFQEKYFAEPVIAAIAKFRYQPAILDGKPVKTYNWIQTVSFQIQNIRKGATPQNARLFDAAAAKINSGALDEADDVLDKIAPNINFLYEYGLLHFDRAMILYKKGKFDEALAVATTVTHRLPTSAKFQPGYTETGSHIPSSAPTVFFGPLEASNYKTLLRLEYAMQVNFGRVREALDTYDRLKQVYNSGLTAEMDDAAAKLRTMMAGADPLYVRAKLVEGRLYNLPSEPGMWMLIPARRIWAIQDVKGRIEGIGIHCRLKWAQIEYIPDSQIEIPESWGDCRVIVSGAPGTSFTFAEAT